CAALRAGATAAGGAGPRVDAGADGAGGGLAAGAARAGGGGAAGPGAGAGGDHCGVPGGGAAGQSVARQRVFAAPADERGADDHEQAGRGGDEHRVRINAALGGDRGTGVVVDGGGGGGDAGGGVAGREGGGPCLAVGAGWIGS